MSYECSGCGRVHGGLPRFFMRGVPETKEGRLIEAHYDHPSLCRSADHFYVRCRLVVRILGDAAAPLEFSCWCELDREDYEALLASRDDETFGSFWMAGTLANPVSGVPDSFGTPVMFEVLPGDPTPCVKWVAPDTELAFYWEEGVSLTFWHELASSVAAGAVHESIRNAE